MKLPVEEQEEYLADPGVQRLSARERWTHSFFLFAVSLLLYLFGNGSMQFTDRDEPRYAGTARTMLQTGDFIVPYFHQDFRYQKPVLTYWIVAGSFALFGVNEFAARLPGGIAAALACVLVERYARRRISARAGTLAGWFLALMPMTWLMAKLCIPDPFQFLFSTICFVALAELARPSVSTSPWRVDRWAVWFWLALALATLTKGPIVAGMLLATVALWWLISFRAKARPTWSSLRLGYWAGIPILIVIALPWFAAIYFTAGTGFFSESVGHQLAQRLKTSFDGRVWLPGYYLLSALIMTLPFTPMVVLGLFNMWQRRRESLDASFLLAWAMGPMLMLEAFPSKQPHYYFPSYPALAIAAGWWCAERSRSTSLAVLSVEATNRLGRLTTQLMMGWFLLPTLSLAVTAWLVIGQKETFTHVVPLASLLMAGVAIVVAG